MRLWNRLKRIGASQRQENLPHRTELRGQGRGEKDPPRLCCEPLESRILLSGDPLVVQIPITASPIHQDAISIDLGTPSSETLSAAVTSSLPSEDSGPSGEIRGSKWHDLDGDGNWDAGELGLAGWTIYLDLDGDGLLDPDEPSDVTDAQGGYAFTGLGPGTYLVAEVPQDGWEQTYPTEDETAAFADSSAPAGFSFHVDTEPGGMQVRLALDHFDITCGSDGLHHIQVQSLEGGSEPGCPELPGRLLRFALPMDADLDTVTLEVNTAQHETLAARFNVAPAPLPASSASDTAPVGTAMAAGRNSEVYGTDAYYGADQATLVGAQQMGRWKIVEVYYRPFAYNPATGSLRVCEDLDLTIHYETNAPLPADLAARGTWDAFAAEMVDNFDEASAWYPSAPAATPGYVIVTTAAIQQNATQLADFVAHKQSQGYNVVVATESQWGGGIGNAAAENLRNWLQTNYVAMDIAYVLLVGNPHPTIGDVPMKVTYTDTPTDYYYADLTSDWNADGDDRYGEWIHDFSSKPIHEVLVGRIPFYGSYAELNSILRKTIDYEIEIDIAWRRNILLPMAISNYANEYGNCSPTYGNPLAEYILSDVADPNGYAGFTLYEKEGLEPVADPCNMPLSHDNVVGEWSSSPYGMVAWWAHGNETGAFRKYWGYDDGDGKPEDREMTWSPFFSSADVSCLDDDHPSVVVQVSCANGYPENSNNLGYRLLTDGAVATYSATRNSSYVIADWSPGLGAVYGDNASYAYFIADRLIGDPTTETAAAALQWCRENFGTGWGGSSWANCVVFNLYGDPSLRLEAQSSGYRCHTVALGAGDAADAVHFGNRQVGPPEITVLGNGIPIYTGDTTVDPDDGTDFGIVTQGGLASSRTFTVCNDGGAPLTLGPVTVPAGFTLTDSLPPSLTPGAWNTFTVRLDTAVVGTKSGDVSFSTSDADENPFRFRIVGVVCGPPEVTVLGNGLAIADGDSLPRLADGTDFGTCVQGQPGPTRTFVVRNDGAGPLTLGPVLAPAGFTLIEGLPGSLDAGAEAAFTVGLDTTSAGTRSGYISFTNSDSNENPYNFRITGRTEPGPPEITVLGNGLVIRDGDATPDSADGTDFGIVGQGSPAVSRTFAVRNDGTSPLMLGSLLLPSGFTLTERLSTYLAPGASDTFTVRLNTTTAGMKSGQITFANNDGDGGDGVENPFNFSILGQVTAPEIEVSGHDVVIVDNSRVAQTIDDTDFGVCTLGEPGPTRTFTVANLGAATLTLGPVSVPRGFTLVDGLPADLAPGARAGFTVRLDSATAGVKGGTITFANNDGNESPFNFRIAGRVYVGPEVTVLAYGRSITDGDTTPSATERTDFGSALQGGAGISRLFTVRNTGDLPLTLGPVGVPEGFSVTEGLSAILPAGGQDTFTVRLDTATLGTFDGDISFSTGDSDENPFEFRIIGTVLGAPEIAVLGNSVGLNDGDTAPDSGNHTDFGIIARGDPPVSRVFMVRNDGTATLTIRSVRVPNGFTLIEGLSPSLAPGESDTFTVQLNSTIVATRAGNIILSNNDGNENPFTFRITGRVLLAIGLGAWRSKSSLPDDDLLPIQIPTT